MRYSTLLLLAALLPGEPAPAAMRLKELVAIEGVRDNPLIGYGLVVGLNGTGDRRQTMFSAQSLANLLQRMGVTVSPQAMRVQNMAAVMVTATLAPFAQPGNRLDVTVGAVGDASSLQGGLLLLTSLRGIDGKTYAVAQGPLVIGGFSVSRSGTSQTLNHPTTGRIPNGAIIEQSAPSVAWKSQMRLQLRQADFTTAVRIAEAVNRHFGKTGEAFARAENSGVVEVALPAAFAARPAEFLAELERLSVEEDGVARVVVNERTGTIVMGQNVHILPVAILHGALTVEIQTTYEVSQPNAMAQGTTQTVQQTRVQTNEEKTRNVVLPHGSTVEELVRSLSAIGATSRDVIAILQNLRVAGALQAELEVI